VGGQDDRAVRVAIAARRLVTSSGLHGVAHRGGVDELLEADERGYKPT
jgi:hypothetical protein